MKLSTTLPDGGEVVVMSPPKGGVDVLRGLKDASCCQEVSDPPADAAELTGAPLNQHRRRHGPAVCLTWFEFKDAPAIGASDELGAEERHAVQRSQGEEVPSQRSEFRQQIDTMHRVQVVDASGVRAQPGRIRVHIRQQ